MFDNNAAKIKKWAKGIFIVGSLVSIVSGIVCMCAIYDGIGFLVGIPVIIFGILSARISSMILYGFGELVSNSYGNSGKKVEAVKEEKEVAQPETQQQYSCYSCGNLVNFGDTNCNNCGAAFDWNKK